MKAKTSPAKLFMILLVAVYVIISLIAGLITEASVSFWEGFACFTVTSAIAFVGLLFFANDKTSIRDVYFNVPIYYIGLIYFLVSGGLAIFQMLLGLLSIKWLIILNLIVLAVFVIYLLLALVNRNNAENVIEKVEQKNDFIRSTAARVQVIADSCTDRDLTSKLESLSEEFKYSRPASAPELYQIEQSLYAAVEQLDMQVQMGQNDEAAASINSIRNLLIRRNDISKRV